MLQGLNLSNKRENHIATFESVEVITISYKILIGLLLLSGIFFRHASAFIHFKYADEYLLR